jgi:spore germination protein YaaH
MNKKYTFLIGCLLWIAWQCPAQDAEAPPGFWERIRQGLRNDASPANDPSGSVIDRYGRVYDWIHWREKKLYDSLSQLGVTNWDKYQDIITYQYTASQDSLLRGPLSPRVTVFGWHPYWMGNAFEQYRFNLLTYISWFSYNIQPETGDCDNPQALDKEKIKALVALAHAAGCKVLLTITSHTAEGNARLLGGADNQRRLRANLLGLLTELGMDGVDVNFENVPAGQTRNMTAFLEALSADLRKKRFTLTVDLPIFDFNHIYELGRLQQSIDLFIITGYDYFNGLSRTDGPVAPLDAPAGAYSIKRSVDRYYQTGVRRQQLLLGLPYYGAVWAGKSSGANRLDTSLQFSGHQTYRAIQGKYCKYDPQFDAASCSKFYFVQPRPDSNYFEKCWFDDAFTLGEKFSWVLNEEMAGVGIWALGYDNGYPEMWEMIARRYGRDSVAVYRDPLVESRYFNLSRSLSDYKSLVVVTGLFMLCFVLLGLVVSLFDWRVREVFFRHKTLRLLYALGGVGILLSVGVFYLFTTDQLLFREGNVWYLGLGILLGAVVAVFFAWYYDKQKSHTP